MKNNVSLYKLKSIVSVLIYLSVLYLSVALVFLDSNSIALETSQFLMILMMMFVTVGVSLCGQNLSSWYLWFILIFILLYCFGTAVGILSFGLGLNFLDYATFFSNDTSNEAAARSYIITSFSLGVLFLCHPIAAYFERKSSSMELEYSHDFFILGRFLIILTLPVVLYNLAYQIKLVSIYGYAYLYTESYQSSSDVIPFTSLFVNLNKVGFLLVFASLPNLKKLNVYFAVFLLVSFFDAMKGARVLLILPFMWVIFYRVRYYGAGFGGKLKFIVLSFFGFLFLFLVQMVRSGQEISFDVLIRFLVFSISKAQYHLAVFIDNSELLSRDFPYFLSTLLFPITYLKYGSQVVGQSDSTALLRGDLNHVMSSTLNYSAYLDGAGMGSSLISELFQYGIIPLAALLIFFVLFYSFFIYLTSRFKLLLVIQPLLFMHVVFSPRDTAFPNTWVYVKFLVLIIGLLLVYHLMLRSSNKSAHCKGVNCYEE
ncbi:O-antigen polysaccharide polymerase Wzy [Vibrio coralliilyticus]